MYNFWIPRILSRSGQQLALHDNSTGEGPLLYQMTLAGIWCLIFESSFMKGLQLFSNHSLYANTTKDRIVAFSSASIITHNPYREFQA